MINYLIDKLSLRKQMIALVLFCFVGNTVIYLLCLFRDSLDLNSEISAWLFIYGIFVALCFLGAIYVGTLSGKKAERIVKALQALSGGNLNKKVEIPGKDEFAWMSYEYNCTVDSVKKTIQSVKRASHSLADSSSEQAASLEQISASLEEMTSMTRQNADNCQDADRAGKATSEIVDSAENLLSDLSSSMQEVARSSEDIRAIIKTIDDIAFQTNLLAVNAAVEAAHAAEAGAGFAVVAAEVNNLADRASQAAKETEVLIEDTVKKLRQGLGLLDKCTGGFKDASVSVEKMVQLVASIAEASDHQAVGIDQLNSAVSQIDRKTQQNSASAQELNALVATFDLEESKGGRIPLLPKA